MDVGGVRPQRRQREIVEEPVLLPALVQIAVVEALRRLRRDGRVVLVRGSEVAVVPVRGVVRAGQAPRVLGRLEEKSRCIEHRFVVSVARAELDAAHETSCDLTVGGHLERVGLHPLDPGISHLGGDQIERGHVRLHCSDEVAERRSEHLGLGELLPYDREDGGHSLVVRGRTRVVGAEGKAQRFGQARRHHAVLAAEPAALVSAWARVERVAAAVI
mmetsp:Transcript_15599/g.33330  ORF Transcript_15599/g.33330 Transcript_15599/m.33330 type:complete len:217 (+) Transcript_15599:2061-2711(+)